MSDEEIKSEFWKIGLFFFAGVFVIIVGVTCWDYLKHLATMH